MISGTRPQQSGFTTIEVIVFLSVSVALVASALALFSTRIPRTQFSQAVNELDIKLKSVGNDVLNGFYPNSGNWTCNGTTINNSNSEQGTNANCIFLGRAIQIGEETDCTIQECDQFRIYTIWGQREKTGGGVATTLTETQPKITDIGVETYTTSFGLSVTKVLSANTNGVAYMSTFGSRPAGINDTSPTGAAQVEIRPLTISGGGSGIPTTDFATPTADFLSVGSELGAANPSNGIALCLKSGTSNQFAVLTLGDAGRPLSNNAEILSQAEWNTRGC